MGSDRERGEKGGILMGRTGFVIEERFYPMPEGTRLTDPVLVEELTGLSWEAFLQRWAQNGDDPDSGLDRHVLVGLVGIAVWQERPNWRRERVVRFVQQVPESAFSIEAPDDEADGDAVPPAQTAGAISSATSASNSGSGSDATLPTSNLLLSGTPTSPTSPEEPSG